VPSSLSFLLRFLSARSFLPDSSTAETIIQTKKTAAHRGAIFIGILNSPFQRKERAFPKEKHD
jgi:hypothetical protein